jgi:hypothetical protein
MANVKITELPVASTPLSGAELVPIVQSGVTKNVTINQINVGTTIPANGQLDIGNGAGFTRTTLSAGIGISITNGAGSISISTLSQDFVLQSFGII